MKKDKRLIPKGLYCYSKKGTCPYWSRKRNLPEQENGYCSYLGQSDWDINREEKIVIQTTYKKGKKIEKEIKCGPDNPSGLSLLWDQCKECGIKSEIPKSWLK